MPIKMIATDLDRTLLRTDKTISDYTAEVLCRCQRRGIKVVFATARPRRTVKHFLDRVLADALVLHNGAAVCVGNETLLSRGIEAAVAKNILLSVQRDLPEVHLSVEIDDRLYANFDVTKLWDNTEAALSNFTDLPNKPADKIIVGVSSMEEVDRLSQYLPEDLYIEMSDGKLGMIMHREATKEKAVQFLASHFGLTAGEVVAFGDDYNDLQMLKGCGIGVAMKNGLDEVKAVADCVCETNDDDGVARWIEGNMWQ